MSDRRYPDGQIPATLLTFADSLPEGFSWPPEVHYAIDTRTQRIHLFHPTMFTPYTAFMRKLVNLQAGNGDKMYAGVMTQENGALSASISPYSYPTGTTSDHGGKKLQRVLEEGYLCTWNGPNEG